MITQKIIARTDSLKLDKIISRYGEDSMRQVVFIIVRPEPDSEEFIPITIPEDAVGSFRILKPSGNFVIVPMSKSVLASGETAFDVVLPASANTAKGSGYYDIRITSDTDKYYYTAQGDFLIDDNIISDEVLEDVSEVNGLIFPDDFLTTEDHVAIIDDDTISTDSTWSSDKISDEIEAHAGGDVSKTVSGNPLTFDDGASAPLVKCDVTITPQQDLHGYDKPWVGGAGKNKCDNSTNTIGLYDEYGTYIANTDYRTSALIKIFPNTAYSVSLFDTSTNTRVASLVITEWDANQNIIQQIANIDTFTTSANAQYVRIRNYGAQSSVVTSDNYAYQLELGSAPTSYAPYSNICPISGYSAVDVNVAESVLDTPHTYTINLGGTYYSGQINAVKGVLVATDAVVDLGTLTWEYDTGGTNRFFRTPSQTYIKLRSNDEINYKCDSYESVNILTRTQARNEIQNGQLSITGGSTNTQQVIVRDDRYTDATAFTSGVSGVYMLYELATPIEIPLTPTVISSLLGNNTMWTDGDNLEVEYITERFQPLVDSIEQNAPVYSTSEHPVATWIDGTPVYERVYTGSWSIYAGGNSYLSGINIPDNMHMISIQLSGEASGYKYVDSPFCMVEANVLMVRNAQFNFTAQNVIIKYYKS